jgi:rhamnose utilization protein RhaD (predicted bifunctional aldolase and dehydrogenase)
MLGSHGLFTWGDTAYESYVNTLEVIENVRNTLKKITAKKARFSAVRNWNLSRKTPA